MGSDASATICFGILFDEYHEFPWGERDAEEWWIDEIHGYKPPFEIYDKQGGYLDGKKPTSKQVDEYYEHRRAFKEKFPLPIDFVYSGSDESSSPILAVPSSVIRTGWDDPKEFSDQNFASVSAEDIQKFKFFCEKYLDLTLELKWYLSAYYG